MDRVITFDDGSRGCDPWVLFENWIEKNGFVDAMDDRPLDVVRWYGEYYKAERLTGDLFAGGEA